MPFLASPAFIINAESTSMQETKAYPKGIIIPAAHIIDLADNLEILREALMDKNLGRAIDKVEYLIQRLDDITGAR